MRCLYNTVDTFVELSEDTNTLLSNAHKEARHDTSYLSKQSEKINEINLQLQENEVNFY